MTTEASPPIIERPSCPKCGPTSKLQFNMWIPKDPRRPGKTYWMCARCGKVRQATLEEAEREVYGEQLASSLAAERKTREEERQREYESILPPKRQRGRHKLPEETKRYYQIGLAVE